MTTIDTAAQFQKLFPKRPKLKLTNERMRVIVARGLIKERGLSTGYGVSGTKQHWSYDLNRHLALAELASELEKLP